MEFKQPDLSEILGRLNTDFQEIKTRYGFDTQPSGNSSAGSLGTEADAQKNPFNLDIRSMQKEVPIEDIEVKPLSGGKFVTEKGKSQNLIKEWREDNPANTAMLRGGLPSWNYEVDHTVPLWAGGEDSNENKVVLKKADHAIKTKVGAVAQALYYNDKITINEARVMQLNWEDRNVDDIYLDEKGQTDLATAENKASEWLKPQKVGIKEWWKSFKEGPKGVVGEAAQGVASGISLGYIPAEGHKEAYKTDEEAKRAGLVRVGGEVVGSLASFVLGYGLLGKAAKATLGFEKGVKGAKTFLGLRKMATAGKTTPELLQTAKRAPVWLKKLGQTGELFKAGGITLERNTALKALANTGVFTTMGQLSKQEEKGFEARVQRFFKDAAWGGMLSLPGQSLKGYTGLATGAWILSSLEGATPMEALTNTAFMVGMHGIGRVKYTERMEEATNNIARNFRHKYGITSKIKPTLDDIVNENQALIKTIRNNVGPTEQATEIGKVIISGRQLYKGGLGKEEKLLEEFKDLKSIFQRTNKLTEAELQAIPSNAANFTKGFNAFKREPSSVGEYKGEPTGTILNTGVASHTNPATAKDIIAYKNAGGQSGDMIFGLIRNEPEFVKAINKKVRGPLSLNRQKNNKYNEKNIQWFGTKEGEIYQLGMWPTEEGIVKMNNYHKKNPKLENMPPLEPKFNNEAVVNAMKESGYEVLPARITTIRTDGPFTPEPYVMLQTSAESWKMAKTLNEKYATTKKSKVKAAMENLPTDREVYTGKDGLPSAPTNELEGDGKALFNAFLREFRETLLVDNPRLANEKLTNLFGSYMNEATATTMLKNAKNIRIKDVVNTITKLKREGVLNSNGDGYYTLIMKRDGYLRKLPAEERAKLDNMYLFNDAELQGRPTRQATGEIAQNIQPEQPQLPMQDIPFKERFSKKMDAVKETAKVVEKKAKETAKKAIVGAKERFVTPKKALEKKVEAKETAKKAIASGREIKNEYKSDVIPKLTQNGDKTGKDQYVVFHKNNGETTKSSRFKTGEDIATKYQVEKDGKKSIVSVVSLKEAQKQYQTNDFSLLSERIVNPERGLNFKTKRYETVFVDELAKKGTFKTGETITLRHKSLDSKGTISETSGEVLGYVPGKVDRKKEKVISDEEVAILSNQEAQGGKLLIRKEDGTMDHIFSERIVDWKKRPKSAFNLKTKATGEESRSIAKKAITSSKERFEKFNKTKDKNPVDIAVPEESAGKKFKKAFEEKTQNWEKLPTLTKEKAKQEYNNKFSLIKEKLVKAEDTLFGGKNKASTEQKYERLIEIMNKNVDDIPVTTRYIPGNKTEKAILDFAERETLRKQLKNHLQEQKEYLKPFEMTDLEYSGGLGDNWLPEQQKKKYKVEFRKTDERMTVFVKPAGSSNKSAIPTEMLRINEKRENLLYKQLSELGKKVETANSKSDVAKNFRTKYGGKKKSDYTLNDIINENELLIKNIKKSVSPDKQAAEIKEVIASGRQLYKGEDMGSEFFKGIKDSISDWYKWLDRGGKKETWRHIEIDKPLGTLHKDDISVTKEFSQLSQLVNLERFDKLPKVLKNFVKSIKETYPNARIQVGTYARGGFTAKEKQVSDMLKDAKRRNIKMTEKQAQSKIEQFDMYEAVRKFTAGPQNKTELEKLGVEYKKLSGSDKAAIDRWDETGKKEFLPDWVSEKIERKWLEDRQSWENTNDMVIRAEIGESTGDSAFVKTSRELEEVQFNSLTWFLEALTQKDVTKEEARILAKKASYMFIQDVKNNMRQGADKKWYSGKTPLYTMLLGTLGAMTAGLSSKKEE